MPSVITIGTFDGLHRGHQAIIRETCRLAKQYHCIPSAITFSYPPRLFFNPSTEPYLLTDIREKQALLKAYGIQKVIVFNFDQRFSEMSPQDFFEKIILAKHQARAVIVGYDFRFGSGRSGDIHFLKKLGEERSIHVHIVPPLCNRSIPISSGRIRERLRKGSLAQARTLLGHPYFLIGQVVRGSGLGKKLGFPTANLKVNSLKIVPDGVFVVRVEILKGSGPDLKPVQKLKGMCNVGFRPTLNEAVKIRTVEVNLFNFFGNLYGKTVTVELVKKLRSEKQFKDLDSLKKQLMQDKAKSVSLLKNRPYGRYQVG